MSSGSPASPIASPSVVLVVEDDMLIRMMAVEMLEEFGFSVSEAPDADAAWEILERRDDVEVLFTDVDMPGSMNGFALARRVHDRWPHIRLVIASGRFTPNSRDIPESGLFLPKPYSTTQVLSAFRSAA